ncbi:MAG: DUF1365 domain-containing protein [Verrucomicrobia bacterium]|nr:DUF1365 domain-containing protein [Verrucomicrobiota bacterium]
MNSCLYSCKVGHSRKRPKKHSFSYRVFMFMVDLDELESLPGKLLFLSHNRSNIYSYRDSDYFTQGGTTPRENVEIFLRANGITGPVGRISLLTHLRTWGHTFNPVSFYFVADEENNPLCLISEVANTFNEQKLYLLKSDKLEVGAYKDSQNKHFYISPFSDLDTRLHFNVRTPDQNLSISINESDSEGTYFFSSLAGKKKELSNLNLLKYTLFFPFITLGIVLSIHWEALKLYLKKIPVRAKANHPELQTGVRPYLKH